MDKKPTALQEKKGVSQPETTSSFSAEIIKKNRAKKNSVEEFISKIITGNISFLSIVQF